MNTHLSKWLLPATAICCFSLIATNVTAKKPIKPPKPPPNGGPVLIEPAFAYYCASNPNSGGVCLANADGSKSAKVFATEKFGGNRYELVAHQADGEGSVLIVDKNDLFRIDYTVDETGAFNEDAHSEPLYINDGSRGIFTAEWEPQGENFAFSDNKGQVFLKSRADFDSSDWGVPVVWDPVWGENQLIVSIAWDPSSDFLYFIRLVSIPGGSGPGWQLRRADIRDALTNNDLVVTYSQCLFASSDSMGSDCPESHTELWHLLHVSVSVDGEVMVSARTQDPDTSGLGFYATYLVPADGDGAGTIVIPRFRGEDWTPDNTILGESDDGKLINFTPPDGGFGVLFNKNATSPDWIN